MIENLEGEIQDKRGGKKGNYILFPQLMKAWAREVEKRLMVKAS